MTGRVGTGALGVHDTFEGTESVSYGEEGAVLFLAGPVLSRKWVRCYD